MGAREKFRKQRKFYLDGYAQYPESFTWHYEMLQAIKNPSTASQTIKFDSASQDAFGRLRTSQPFTIFDSSHRYSDNGLWATAATGGGAAVFSSNEGLVNLNVNNVAGDSVKRETFKVFSYQPGKSFTYHVYICYESCKTGSYAKSWILW